MVGKGEMCQIRGEVDEIDAIDGVSAWASASVGECVYRHMHVLKRQIGTHSLSLSLTHTHTHTPCETYYTLHGMYYNVCVCVYDACVCIDSLKGPGSSQHLGRNELLV